VTAMTRRAFLAGAALAAAGAGGLLYRAATDEGFDADLAQTEAVARLFDELEPARRIGRAYLDDHPDEREERALVRLLEERPGWRGVWHNSPRAVAKLARRTMQREYDTGQTVAVEGWILSRTEARLCALTTFG
jgi:hypothetical protein